jgi:hypothetical protein
MCCQQAGKIHAIVLPMTVMRLQSTVEKILRDTRGHVGLLLDWRMMALRRGSCTVLAASGGENHCTSRLPLFGPSLAFKAELAARGFVTAKTSKPFVAAQIARMLRS